MAAYVFSVPCIVILISSFLYLRLNGEFRKSRTYFLLSIRILILAYNLFIVYGNQIPILARLTFYLTYSDAMLFSMSGPLFYVFILEILNERPATSALNAKHLWPVVPGLMFFATFSSLPHPMKVESFNGMKCGILPDDLLYFAETAGILFYLVLSIIRINKYLLHYKGKVSSESLRQLHVYSWFLHFSIALSLGYVILSTIIPHPIGIQLVIIFFLMIQTLSELLLIFCIKHKTIIFTNEIQEITDNHQTAVSGENTSNVSKIKISATAEKLEKIMSERKLYLNHNLDMDLLVKQSGLNSNQIKTSLKEKYSMSVPEFINMYRIEHAKVLLSKAGSIAKIDVLAHDCGYSTRSNFYRAFKNATGLTPNEYRNSVYK